MNNKGTGFNYFTPKEAALFFSVSPATISNWVRQGLLVKLDKGKIDKVSAKKLKDEILEGRVNRLSQRANRRYSFKITDPKKMTQNLETQKWLKEISLCIIENNIELSSTIFALVLLLLHKRNELNFSQSDIKIFLDQYFKSPKKIKTYFRRVAIFNFIMEQDLNLYLKDVESAFFIFLEYGDLPEEDDLLGLLYQSLSLFSDRSKKGSWYTPGFIIDQLLENVFPEYSDLKNHQYSSFIDPCCGSGQFLIQFAKKYEKDILSPINLYGIDSDPIAILIAGINIFLYFSKWNDSLNLYCGDSLSIDLENINFLKKYDILITNPPWGSFKKKSSFEERNSENQICSNELFSHFLQLAKSILVPDGILRLLLPESSFTVRLHQDFRWLLIENFKINKIQLYEKVFNSVLSNVIGLFAEKKNIENLDYHYSFKICSKQFSRNASISELLNNKNLLLSLRCTGEQKIILEKMVNNQFCTLKENAEWALGIVTGDNKKFILDESSVLCENSKNIIKNIITGKEILPFKIKESNIALRFYPRKFQQIASEKFYKNSSKLVYKFISNRLVFAIDSKKRYTLNSANILIPNKDFFDPEVLTILLNSMPIAAWFRLTFCTRKILRSQLEQIPFPYIDSISQTKLKKWYEQMKESGAEDFLKLKNDSDLYIAKLYNLTQTEFEKLTDSIF